MAARISPGMEHADRLPSGCLLSDLRRRELTGRRVHAAEHDDILLSLTSDRRGEGPWSVDMAASSRPCGVGWIETNPGFQTVPAFVVKFCDTANRGRLLAVADEDGYLAVVNTAREIPESTWPEDMEPGQPSCCGFWRAHENAIFDLCWTHRDQRIVTASADHSIRLWDTKRAACIGEGVAHHGTVKCVAAMPGHPDILASGGRDGVVALWDTRLPGSPCPGLQGPALLPVSTVPQAHGPGAPGKHAASKKKNGTASAGVTALAFLADAWLLATGGTDGTVKTWDTRALYRPLHALFPDTASDLADAAGPSQSRRRSGRARSSSHAAPSAGPPGSRPFGTPTPVTAFAARAVPAFVPCDRAVVHLDVAAPPCGGGPATAKSRPTPDVGQNGAAPRPGPSAGPGAPGTALEEAQAGIVVARMSTARKRALVAALAASPAPAPLHVARAPGGEAHGVTCIAASPGGDMLAVSYAKESVVRTLDGRRPWLGFQAEFRGHRTDGFFVKCCFSPCGDWLLCGSSDGRPHIYPARNGGCPIVLEGHAGEVSSVAWCTRGPPQLATASDDGTVRVWGPVPAAAAERRVSGARRGAMGGSVAPIGEAGPGVSLAPRAISASPALAAAASPSVPAAPLPRLTQSTLHFAVSPAPMTPHMASVRPTEPRTPLSAVPAADVVRRDAENAAVCARGTDASPITPAMDMGGVVEARAQERDAGGKENMEPWLRDAGTGEQGGRGVAGRKQQRHMAKGAGAGVTAESGSKRVSENSPGCGGGREGLGPGMALATPVYRGAGSSPAVASEPGTVPNAVRDLPGSAGRRAKLQETGKRRAARRGARRSVSGAGSEAEAPPAKRARQATIDAFLSPPKEGPGARDSDPCHAECPPCAFDAP